MKQKIFRACRAKAASLCVISNLLSGFGLVNSWAETSPKYYAVEVSASVQASPAQITLKWAADPRATGFRVYRKLLTATAWTPVASLPGSALSYTDTSVSVGSTYEYQISKTTSFGYNGLGYIYSGINAPMIDARGKIILIVDKTHASDLSRELSRLEMDLIGDGWTVLRHDVSPNDSPAAVKNLIKADYNADRENVKAVFLFGHVAVPYSGDFHPDAHDDHKGAWPADTFYGDMDGVWTDSSVHSTSAQHPRNRNVPGDGKFDQVELPSDIELQVGRVDLSNMTCFANKTPSRSEKDLLRQYLNKDHNFRHRILNVERRGLICDSFGEKNGEAFAASGWRNFSPFFGAENVSEVPGGNYFSTVTAQSYLWSYGTGGGSYYTCNGIGSSDDFARNDIKSVFTMFLGSYFGDWDNESNFLRAPLGSTTYGLTAAWAGRPHWFLHHMALGETIGFSTRLSQNNGKGGLYGAQNYGTREVHVALMGDPALRMHPVVPPSGVTATQAGQNVQIKWSPSSDADIQGYYVYRASSPKGPFTRLTRGAPEMTTTFTDLGAAGTYTYMVRAIKLEKSGSGTYLNPSQGVFASVNGNGTPTDTAPVEQAPQAPVSLTSPLVSKTQVTLTWIDTSSNEQGFRIERKSGSSGSYVALGNTPANSSSFNDTSVAPGTQYTYRVLAFGAAGDSEPSNESNVSIPTGGATQGPAQAIFAGEDSTTGGNWKGKYGSDGFYVIGDTVNYPSYAVVTSNGNQPFAWNDTTTDSRALQRASAGDRLAACWYSDAAFSMEVNFVDGQTHRLTLYCLDWDTVSRSQTIEIVDASSGAILDQKTISGFSGGRYLMWDIKGRVQVRCKKVNGNNAVLMGMFFGPAGTQLQDPVAAKISVDSNAASALAQGKFRLNLTGTPGERYSIEASDDLLYWTKVKEVTLEGSSLSFEDAEAVFSSQRFYRAVRLD